MVTINEIAQIAKVSVSTVSKALTGKTDVSKETRSQIIEIASKLGYKKNDVFLQNVLCVLINETNSSKLWYDKYELINDLKGVYLTEKYRVKIMSIVSIDEAINYVSSEKNNCSMYILVGFDYGDDVKLIVANTNKPVLNLSNYIDNNNSLSIGYDLEQMFIEMKSYLLAKGAKKIAFYNNNENYIKIKNYLKQFTKYYNKKRKYHFFENRILNIKAMTIKLNKKGVDAIICASQKDAINICNINKNLKHPMYIICIDPYATRIDIPRFDYQQEKIPNLINIMYKEIQNDIYINKLVLKPKLVDLR